MNRYNMIFPRDVDVRGIIRKIYSQFRPAGIAVSNQRRRLTVKYQNPVGQPVLDDIQMTINMHDFATERAQRLQREADRKVLMETPANQLTMAQRVGRLELLTGLK